MSYRWFLLIPAAAVVIALPLLPALDRAGVFESLGAFPNSQALSAGQAQPTANRTYQSPEGKWSVEIPTDWHVTETDPPDSAAFWSYDPAKAPYERERGTTQVLVPPSEVQITVRLLYNHLGLDARAAADMMLASPDGSRSTLKLISRRDDLVISGQPATLLVLLNDVPPRPLQTIREYFVVSASKDRILVIQAWPDNTVRSDERDQFIATFTIQ